MVWKVHDAWIDGYDSQNKDKDITIMKNKRLLFFCAVYHSKNHMIPHLVIAAILDVILNIILRWKTTITCQSNFQNTTEKYQKIVTNCEFDLRLNFALNGGHLGHHLWYLDLVNQTCECFILIVCIIRPLNIDKMSKSKCFISSFRNRSWERNWRPPWTSFLNFNLLNQNHVLIWSFASFSYKNSN